MLPAFREGNDLATVDERLFGLNVNFIFLRKVLVDLDPARPHDVAERRNGLSRHLFFDHDFVLQV